jgi:hypothetical protein
MTSAPRLGPDRIPLIVALTSWFWLTAVNVRHGTCRTEFHGVSVLMVVLVLGPLVEILGL